MIILLSILYVVIGSAITYFYKKGVQERNYFSFSEEETIIALLIGIFWPIAAPFAFAILLASRIK